MKIPGGKGSAIASNEEWTAWGELDPLYGVATKRGHAQTGEDPWTDDQFYRLGAADWPAFRRTWEQYGLRRGACVEIGCGAGRMTARLALCFDSVHGLDVSEGMLQYARPRMPSNVSLHLTHGAEIPLPDGSVDAAFSTHVLQHFSDAGIAAAYFKEMVRVLSPGGTIMIHLPIIVWPWDSSRRIHKMIHRATGRLAACRVQLRRYAHRTGLLKKPPMRVIWYDLPWLYRTLERTGFSEIEIRILFVESEMALQHPFVFATKAVPQAAPLRFAAPA